VKSSALDREQAKYDRKLARKREKDRVERLERERQAAIREQRFVMDKGRCRAYDVPLSLVTKNPRERAHCHHVIFRSAGGSDELHNRVTLSPKAHEQIHDHKLDIFGEPNSTLTFELKNPETGQVLERWESPLP
jgi:5-methylcytosine-specific restriction endonuclease McrA